jgi:hypothetical protein
LLKKQCEIKEQPSLNTTVQLGASLKVAETPKNGACRSRNERHWIYSPKRRQPWKYSEEICFFIDLKEWNQLSDHNIAR